ncbi:hypothetical protein [Halorhodospira halophila]|uniref:hypothetical protein n=1 Tax=Halorhodospira halophila TaxID=1053 RepID=UPI001912F266|nr:hypothetical protein [Halorhodospira halophila]MBK5935378.1 hypothetical protein [Halorhodospira halophila]
MDCIFHIGLGKTATTYLQSEHFPRIGALGKRQGGRTFRRAFRDAFLSKSPGFWQTRRGRSLIKHLANHSPRRDQVIYTDEALYRPRMYPRQASPIQADQPERLVEHMKAFGEAWGDLGSIKVFFFTRNQPEWLASAYAQSSQFQPRASQADFERRIDDILTTPGDERIRYLEYGRLLVSLQEALGEEATLAMPYERMSDEEIRTTVQRFLGCDEFLAEPLQPVGKGPSHNVRRSSAGRWKLSPHKLSETRLQHKWRKVKGHLGLPADPPTRPADEEEIHLRQATAERIREAFEPSNRLFAERSGWSLDHLGYWPGESSAKSQDGEAGRRGA